MIPVSVIIAVALLILAAMSLMMGWRTDRQDGEWPEGLLVFALVCTGIGGMFLRVTYLPQLPGYTVVLGLLAVWFLWFIATFPFKYARYRAGIREIKKKYNTTETNC